jgi:predicted nuclease of predicted toxin-antitoxin system
MKFLLDHDVPDVAGRILIAAGHQVAYLRLVVSANASDERVLKLSTERGEILITCNRDDFLTLGRECKHAGIIILIRRRNRALENSKLLALIEVAGEAGILGNINFA